MNWILPLLVLIFFELVADIFAKSWSLESKNIYAFLSLLSYLIANTFWLFALKNGSGLGRGALIFSLASAIIALALGFLFYHEEISKFQSIGIVLGIVSLVLIFWE